MANYLTFAQDKPIFVFSTISHDREGGGRLVPDIAVNPDGTWRQATFEDVWAGQEF